MNQLKYAGLLILLTLVLFSCKKSEEENNSNVITIKTGVDAGFTHIFSPNLGFWSYSTTTVRYVHLVFGDTENNTVSGINIMSILFYYEGNNKVSFPSPAGQHVNIGLDVNGNNKYYTVDDAVLDISEITDDHLKGTLSGSFVSGGPEFDVVEISMDIDIQLSEIN